jgi:hypothetical protein
MISVCVPSPFIHYLIEILCRFQWIRFKHTEICVLSWWKEYFCQLFIFVLIQDIRWAEALFICYSAILFTSLYMSTARTYLASIMWYMSIWCIFFFGISKRWFNCSGHNFCFVPLLFLNIPPTQWCCKNC